MEIVSVTPVGLMETTVPAVGVLLGTSESTVPDALKRVPASAMDVVLAMTQFEAMESAHATLAGLAMAVSTVMPPLATDTAWYHSLVDADVTPPILALDATDALATTSITPIAQATTVISQLLVATLELVLQMALIKCGAIVGWAMSTGIVISTAEPV